MEVLRIRAPLLEPKCLCPHGLFHIHYALKLVTEAASLGNFSIARIERWVSHVKGLNFVKCPPFLLLKIARVLHIPLLEEEAEAEKRVSNSHVRIVVG